MSGVKQLLISRHIIERYDSVRGAGAPEYVYSYLFDGRDFGSKKVDSTTYSVLMQRLSEIEAILEVSDGGKIIGEKLQEFGGFMTRLLVPERLRLVLFSLEKRTHLAIQVQDHSVPWELLYDSFFLGFHCCLGRNASSPSRNTSADARSKALRVLLIGNPTRDLDFAAEEIKEISDLINDTFANIEKSYDIATELRVLTETAATKEKVLFEVLLGNDSWDLIHFAGHATPDHGYGTGAALTLADGSLRAYEVEEMKISPVVFANSCYSGAIRSKSPLSGYYAMVGLAPSFLKGGALGYIAPLWPVPDHVAKKVAGIFYREVLCGTSIGEALALAKEQVFEAFHDYSVYGYVLFGNPEKRLSLFEPQITSGTYINDIGFERVYAIELEFSRLELLAANDLPWILWQENDFVDWVSRIAVSEERRSRMLKTLFQYKATFRDFVLSGKKEFIGLVNLKTFKNYMQRRSALERKTLCDDFRLFMDSPTFMMVFYLPAENEMEELEIVSKQTDCVAHPGESMYVFNKQTRFEASSVTYYLYEHLNPKLVVEYAKKFYAMLDEAISAYQTRYGLVQTAEQSPGVPAFRKEVNEVSLKIIKELSLSAEA